ncbi:hypothetical protein PG985_013685 [Apiospora marii]|uniref:uncharacterized protein n=1 Tax=Apiospora marii TaxID=335849 RepID=UPI00312F972C
MELLLMRLQYLLMMLEVELGALELFVGIIEIYLLFAEVGFLGLLLAHLGGELARNTINLDGCVFYICGPTSKLRIMYERSLRCLHRVVNGNILLCVPHKIIGGLFGFVDSAYLVHNSLDRLFQCLDLNNETIGRCVNLGMGLTYGSFGILEVLSGFDHVCIRDIFLIRGCDIGIDIATAFLFAIRVVRICVARVSIFGASLCGLCLGRSTPIIAHCRGPDVPYLVTLDREKYHISFGKSGRV